VTSSHALYLTDKRICFMPSSLLFLWRPRFRSTLCFVWCAGRRQNLFGMFERHSGGGRRRWRGRNGNRTRNQGRNRLRQGRLLRDILACLLYDKCTGMKHQVGLTTSCLKKSQPTVPNFGFDLQGLHLVILSVHRTSRVLQIICLIFPLNMKYAVIFRTLFAFTKQQLKQRDVCDS